MYRFLLNSSIEHSNGRGKYSDKGKGFERESNSGGWERKLGRKPSHGGITRLLPMLLLLEIEF